MCIVWFLFWANFLPHKKRLRGTFGDDDDDFDDMAITAGYGNTKFVDDAQVRLLLDSFCWLLLLLFVVGVGVFEREEDSQIIYRENVGSNSSRVSKNPIRCPLEERRRPFLEDDTHPPTALGGGDDVVATFFFLSLSLSSMMMMMIL